MVLSISAILAESCDKEMILLMSKLLNLMRCCFCALESYLRELVRSLMALVLSLIVYLTTLSYSISEDIALSFFSASALYSAVNMVQI